MNFRLRWIAIVSVLLALTPFVALAAPPSKGEIVAFILKIEGRIYWKPKRDKAPLQLDPRKDRAKPLYFREWIKVNPGSKLCIVDLRGKQAVEQTLQTPVHGKAQWVTLPHRATEEQARLWKALKAYAALGGRNKGGGSQIFSPAQHGVVRPETLVLRWVPIMPAMHVTLTITDRQKHEIWRQKNIDSGSGLLVSETAQDALKRYRSGGHNGELTLALADGTNKPVAIRFLLMDPRAENALQTELASWDKQQGLICHLGRAYTFTTFDMYNDAADEYEAALREAPESTSLLIAAIVTQEDIGNFPRGKELRMRLPAGVHVPGDP